MRYIACSSCAVVIANGDDSHLNEADAQVVAEAIEGRGPLALVGEKSCSGYFDCEFCESVEIGDYIEFENDADAFEPSA